MRRGDYFPENGKSHCVMGSAGPLQGEHLMFNRSFVDEHPSPELTRLVRFFMENHVKSVKRIDTVKADDNNLF